MDVDSSNFVSEFHNQPDIMRSLKGIQEQSICGIWSCKAGICKFGWVS